MEAGPSTSKSSDHGGYSYNSTLAWAESEEIIRDNLSASRLKQISGEEDLKKVTMLDMVVDTSETSLGNFGQHLPNLVQLKLSDSVVPTVRDIGTSLRNLTILWLARCKLAEVDGIASLLNLKELYLAFNNIDDASPISFLDDLEVLDLEANRISEVGQLDYLAMMQQLTTLTLADNPITKLDCSAFGALTYRQYAIAKMPQLIMLDDESSSKQHVDRVTNMSGARHSAKDVDVITAAIKEGLIVESDAKPIISKRDKAIFSKLGDDVIPASFFQPRPKSAFGAYRPSTPGMTSSTSSSKHDDSSSQLTFGDPHCGNAITLLRKRRRDKSEGGVNRPTTALGIQHRDLHDITLLDADDVDDDDVSGESPSTSKKKHSSSDEVNQLLLNDDDDDEPLPAYSTMGERADSRSDFDAAKPPEFLHRLKPVITPKKLPVKAPNKKPFYHFDDKQQRPPVVVTNNNNPSSSGRILPRLLPAPPIPRGSGHRGGWTASSSTTRPATSADRLRRSTRQVPDILVRKPFPPPPKKLTTDV